MKNNLENLEFLDQVPSKSRKFAIDVSWVFFAMVVDLGIGFLLKIILGNYFGASGLGAYSMVLVIYLMASMIGGIGIPAALIKYIAEYKDDKSKFLNLVSCGFINSLILGIILAGIIFSISDLLANFFNIEQLGKLLKIIALIFPFLLINDTLTSVLNGLRKMKYYAFAQIFRRASILILTFLLVFIGLGVEGAVWALVISATLSTILLLIISRDHLYLRISNYAKTTRTLMTFGSKVFAGSVLATINTRADMICIGYFLMDKDVGIYAVALMFVYVMIIIPQAVQKITYPAISELWAKKLYKRIENMINKCLKYNFIILGGIGILLIFFAKDIIQFIYFNKADEFLPAILPLQILVLAFVFRGALISIGGVFGSIGRPGITLHIILMITILNVCLNIVLVPIYGISGAAVATSFSFIFASCINIYLIKKFLKIKIYLDWFVNVVLISFLIYFLMLVLEGLINHFVIGFIGIILYCGLIFLTNTITKEDLQLFKRILNLK